MPAKRGDRVAPPARPDGWEARFATSEAAKGWEELCRVAQANTWEAWIVLTERNRPVVIRQALRAWLHVA